MSHLSLCMLTESLAFMLEAEILMLDRMDIRQNVSLPFSHGFYHVLCSPRYESSRYKKRFLYNGSMLQPVMMLDLEFFLVLQENSLYRVYICLCPEHGSCQKSFVAQRPAYAGNQKCLSAPAVQLCFVEGYWKCCKFLAYAGFIHDKALGSSCAYTGSASESGEF